MDQKEFLYLLAGGLAGGAASWLSGVWARRVERDRLWHQVALLAASTRNQCHLELGKLCSVVFRDLVSMGNATTPVQLRIARGNMNSAKNFFYEHRVYFSDRLAKCFEDLTQYMVHWLHNCEKRLATGSSKGPYAREKLVTLLNHLRVQIRMDLRLDQLDRTIGEAHHGPVPDHEG